MSDNSLIINHLRFRDSTIPLSAKYSEPYISPEQVEQAHKRAEREKERDRRFAIIAQVEKHLSLTDGIKEIKEKFLAAEMFYKECEEYLNKE